MRQIPFRTRIRVIQLFLEGKSYDEIAAIVGIAKSSISNIVDEFRKGRVPDYENLREQIDALRELSLRLQKHKLNIGDAVVGLAFFRKFTELGVEPRDIEGWLELSKRISSSHPEDAVIQGAIRLVRQEKESGFTYTQMLQDFEAKLKERAELEGKTQGLKEKIKELKGKEEEARKRVAALVSQIEGLTATTERLSKLGIERVEELARFVEEYELLGFDSQQVKELADIKREMAEEGIKSGELKKFFKEKGSMSKQISELGREKDILETVLSDLKAAVRSKGRSLDKLARLKELLASGIFSLPCKWCGSGIKVALSTPSHYRELLASSQLIAYPCPFCGQWSHFTAWEILAGIGLLALETKSIGVRELPQIA